MNLFGRPPCVATHLVDPPHTTCSSPYRARGGRLMGFKQALKRNDTIARRANNLGMLQSIAEAEDPASASSAQAFLEASSSSAALELGPRLDGSAATTSLLLLVLLIALSGNRILGLERFFGKWVKEFAEQRRYAARNQAIVAREQLERQYKEEGGSGPGE